MPFAQTIPTFKIVKVGTKIVLILLCHYKGISIDKADRHYGSVVTAAVIAGICGLTTLDFVGLLAVCVKVFKQLQNVPVDARIEYFTTSTPVTFANTTFEHFTSHDTLMLTIGESNLTVANKGVIGIIEDMGIGVVGEIATALLEEFNFADIGSFLISLFDLDSFF